jgi:hypothetical protein
MKIILADPIGRLSPSKLRQMFNKPTAFYWLKLRQRRDESREMTLTSGITLPAIYDTWYELSGPDPNIEFGHFFANPIRITSAGQQPFPGLLMPTGRSAHKP